MQIIQNDPNEVIPNISENIFHDKILITVLRERGLGIYIGQVVYDNNGYVLRGNNREGTGFSIWTVEQCNSILQLISTLWNIYKQYYEIKFYVLDTWQELAQVIQEANQQCPS